ncbi:MAG TPA: uracil-DNA glycosylase [Alphaproteobacteria bacterium]|nr:uracil-DNA glycosylase [Alphaproteobacteria bacterium]
MNQPANMHALLQWYIAAGADEATDAEPRNRFDQPARPAVTVAAVPVAPPSVAPPNAEYISAAEIAAGCANLAELRGAIAAFDGCALKRTATNTVIGDGNEAAALMVIGEAPGAEEDRRGLPFVGPAGQLLDRMLAAIGLDRSGVYISNILPWRPPGNRSPTSEEIALCQPFVERQIVLVQPRVLILVGVISAKALLGKREGITRLRGTWREFTPPGTEQPIATMATFHPAYLLRQPSAKREVWRDLLAVQKKLGETGT